MPSAVDPAFLYCARLFVRHRDDFGDDGSELPRRARRLLRLNDLATRSANAEALTRIAEAPGPAVRKDTISRNAAVLARLFGLDENERELVSVLARERSEPALAEMIQALTRRAVIKKLDAVASALGVEIEVLQALVRPRATLVASGLVITNAYAEDLQLVETLLPLMREPKTTASRFRKVFFGRPPRPKLTLADFAHLAEDAELVRRTLRSAVQRRALGVNILLYGRPGTGKSELARVIAADLGLSLFAIEDEAEEGGMLDGHERLLACSSALQLLRTSRKSVILFDEVEDAFPRESASFAGLSRKSTQRKAWTHRLLEENRVPMVWITNDVDHLEAATLRRFTLALELRPPPVSVRRRVLKREFPNMTERWVERYASDDRMTLAHVAQTKRVAKLLDQRDDKKVERSLSRALDSALHLATGRARSPNRAPMVLGNYDPDLVNADCDLDALAEVLATTSADAALCLHGPPGSGKTAFVAHIAERLRRPLQVERASTILGAYVGETESNIAEMFAQARADKAILFLDEADSFLGDRRRATRSWEISQVNELLMQMEQHEGIYFCATNLMEALDPAAMRRFAMKITFRPLTDTQRWTLFARLTERQADEAEIRGRLGRLSILTAGDFAAASRHLALTGETGNASALLRVLESDASLRAADGARRAGFA